MTIHNPFFPKQFSGCDVTIDPSDGEVTIWYKENDAWYGFGEIVISLEDLESLIEFARKVRDTFNKGNI